MISVLSILEWLAKYGLIDILFGIGIVSLIWRGIRRYIPRNLDHLHVHVQSQKFHVSTELEEYDYVLSIFISNAGLKNLYIARAFFKPLYRTIWPFYRRSKLPIYSKAFKSAAHKAYELKFGKAWWEFDTLIKPGERDNSYIPLSKIPDEAIIANRKCGTVILEYSTAGQSGKHVVRV